MFFSCFRIITFVVPRSEALVFDIALVTFTFGLSVSVFVADDTFVVKGFFVVGIKVVNLKVGFNVITFVVFGTGVDFFVVSCIGVDIASVVSTAAFVVVSGTGTEPLLVPLLGMVDGIETLAVEFCGETAEKKKE